MSFAATPDAALPPLRAPRLRRSDASMLAAQLGLMLDTGIALDAALGAVAEQADNSSVQLVVRDIQEQVEAGVDFSAALNSHPKSFDKVFVALVRSSERSGTLAQSLLHVSEHMQKEQHRRGRIRAALAYPALMLVLAVGVTIFLLTYVMPRFSPIFQRRGTKLPLITQVLIGVSDELAAHWMWWLAGAVAAVAGLVVFLRTDSGSDALDETKLRLPIWGPAYRKAVISRCIQTLGVMLRSGVPVLDAIQLCAEVAGSRPYQKVWNRVVDEVSSGARISDALPARPMFPPTLLQMIRAGEDSGRLPEVLHRVSQQYEQEVEVSLKAASTLIEPILISVMGVIVGAIGLALLLPIFSLSRPAGL